MNAAYLRRQTTVAKPSGEQNKHKFYFLSYGGGWFMGAGLGTGEEGLRLGGFKKIKTVLALLPDLDYFCTSNQLITSTDMKKFTRFYSVIVVTLLWALASPHLSAQDIYQDGGIYFVLNDDGGATMVGSPNGYSGALNIPATVKQGNTVYPVTMIENNSCMSNNNLIAVTIPGSVKEIGAYAFGYCKSLSSVTLTNGVRSIGSYAFTMCDLNTIFIPGSVEDIGAGSFCNCTSLSTVTIVPGDNNTYIRSAAFRGCSSLQSITIPKNVYYIDSNGVFNDCTSLKEILVDDANESFCSISGVLYTKDKTMLMYYPNARASSYAIPNHVESIGFSAFSGCTSLRSVFIPSSVNWLGGYAFQTCTSLTSVSIPGSISSISFSSFNGCTSLKEIELGEGIETIESYAFQCSAVRSITLPSTLTSIGSFAFGDCRSLRIITSLATTPPAIASENCFSVYNAATVKVPAQSIEAYKTADVWSRFAAIVDLNSNYIFGDVNHDGEVNIVDVNDIITVILGGNPVNEADVNSDGDINIADVNNIINILLEF